MIHLCNCCELIMLKVQVQVGVTYECVHWDYSKAIIMCIKRWPVNNSNPLNRGTIEWMQWAEAINFGLLLNGSALIDCIIGIHINRERLKDSELKQMRKDVWWEHFLMNAQHMEWSMKKYRNLNMELSLSWALDELHKVMRSKDELIIRKSQMKKINVKLTQSNGIQFQVEIIIWD